MLTLPDLLELLVVLHPVQCLFALVGEFWCDVCRGLVPLVSVVNVERGSPSSLVRYAFARRSSVAQWPGEVGGVSPINKHAMPVALAGGTRHRPKASLRLARRHLAV